MGARIRRFGGTVLAAALVVGLTSAATSATTSTAPDRDALRQAMAELARSGAAGVQVRLHDATGDWTGAAGVRELSGGAVPTNGRFRAGSITKMFVSTVVLQLVDEGTVALDDPIDEYLPEYGIDPRITVRMLLQHTSGLFNYTGEARPDGTLEPGIPLYGKDFEDNRFRTYTPAELVGVALSKPARFEPGTSWSYSNTNYVLAGQLIERVTGKSYADQIRHRVLRPLGLRNTVLPGARTTIPGPHAHGYYAYKLPDQLRVLDVSRINPTWATSAGEIISTTRDLDTFITALFDGDLLPADLLAEMRDVLPIGAGSGYGLGLQTIDAGPSCGGVYEGHTGGMHGYQSYLFSNADGSTRFELSVTNDAIDVADPEAAQRFAAAANNVLIAIVCGAARPADRATMFDGLAVA
jgi:D-alanyl-D-alanine carboxypeptidase